MNVRSPQIEDDLSRALLSLAQRPVEPWRGRKIELSRQRELRSFFAGVLEQAGEER